MSHSFNIKRIDQVVKNFTNTIRFKKATIAELRLIKAQLRNNSTVLIFEMEQNWICNITISNNINAHEVLIAKSKNIYFAYNGNWEDFNIKGIGITSRECIISNH